MEDSDIKVPNIINGLDILLSLFIGIFLDKEVSLSLLIIFEKGFFTSKNKFNRLLVH